MNRRNFVKTAGVAAAVGATGCMHNPPQRNNTTTDPPNRPKSTVGQDGNYSDMTGQSEVTVDVGAANGFKFDPADITIDAGTTVRWVWTGNGGQHNVAHADGESPYEAGGDPPIKKEAGGSNPLFRSVLTGEQGHEFTYTFDQGGTYDYVCTVHVNQGMIGSVQVEGGEGN